MIVSMNGWSIEYTFRRTVVISIYFMLNWWKFLRLVTWWPFESSVDEKYMSIENKETTATTTKSGGARGVMVIVVGYGHGDTSSNPGRDWLHFT